MYSDINIINIFHTSKCLLVPFAVNTCSHYKWNLFNGTPLKIIIQVRLNFIFISISHQIRLLVPLVRHVTYRSFPSAGMNWVFTICLLALLKVALPKNMQNFILVWKRNKNASGHDENILAHPDHRTSILLYFTYCFHLNVFLPFWLKFPWKNYHFSIRYMRSTEYSLPNLRF